jgi:hypothetical protein
MHRLRGEGDEGRLCALGGRGTEGLWGTGPLCRVHLVRAGDIIPHTLSTVILSSCKSVGAVGTSHLLYLCGTLLVVKGLGRRKAHSFSAVGIDLVCSMVSDSLYSACWVSRHMHCRS